MGVGTTGNLVQFPHPGRAASLAGMKGGGGDLEGACPTGMDT